MDGSFERDSRLTVENIPGLVAILTPAGEVDAVNQRLVEYCGQPLEAMRQWGTNGTVLAEDVAVIAPVFTKAIAAGTSYDFEARIRRFDGVYRWCEIRGQPLRDATGGIACWYSLLIDIDDRKRAEDALRASERTLKLLIDTIPALVWRGSATGELDYLNQRAVEYLGFTAEALTGGRWLELVFPEHRDSTVQRWLQSVTTGSSYDDTYKLRRADGQYRWIRSVGEPLRDTDGRIAQWYGLVVDVDDRKRAEESLDTLRSELARATRVMSLGTLTASIAHEVNQPLSGIITNAGTLLRMLDADPPNIDGARETARRTIRDGNRASDVIARLRALFSKKAFTLEPMDLNEATREVIALSSGELQRNRVVVHLELADDLPVVAGDRVQLQQVILNLLRNASDAMAGVDDRPRQLVIRTERVDGKHVRVTVRDAGVGVDPQHIDKLFEAFYITKSGGMGIGLSVSRSIVERHHGRLWVEPNDGPGATFSFFVPSIPPSE